jgi:hypothetical protein
MDLSATRGEEEKQSTTMRGNRDRTYRVMRMAFLFFWLAGEDPEGIHEKYFPCATRFSQTTPHEDGSDSALL